MPTTTAVKATMSFRRDDDKCTTLSVTDANAATDAVAMNSAMDIILEKNVFAPQGSNFKSKVGGKLVSTTTDVFEMTTI
ncbi:MAG: DUF2922 domain-containing protein [Eubacteriaceae bacterium]